MYVDIPGYEGLYQINEIGQVRSLKRKVKNRYGYRYEPEKILKPIITNNHLTYNLSKNGKMEKIYVKKILRELFQAGKLRIVY